jgi:hypothetical protein
MCAAAAPLLAPHPPPLSRPQIKALGKLLFQLNMRRAFFLLPRLQSSAPALARPFASSASHPAQPDAQADATEDHSRDGMVSAALKKMRLAHTSLFSSNDFSLACCGMSEPTLPRQVANTVALMDAHLNGLRFIKTRCNDSKRFYTQLHFVEQCAQP